MKAKVLLYDIETAPNLGYYWQLYKEGNIIETAKHWYIISFAWKWLGDKKTYCKALPDYKLYKKDAENDLDLIKDLWSLFDSADITISHNGIAFDSKKSRARFIHHGLPPPTPYKELDTKLIAKRYFKFDSNKLDSIGDYLGVGRKMVHTGFDLWKGCLNGDKKSWNTMKRYNIQDVVLLENIYKKMLPYIESHPNIALINGDLVACPNCGSKKMQRRGYMVNRVGRKERFQCQDCGSWHSRPIAKDPDFPKQMR
jgi:predicted RNA-binding Zn-ribbon protein involved in translation (DUF1610 family)